MASKKEKSRAVQFLSSRLEESGLYHILECRPEEVLLADKPELQETPKTYAVMVANFISPIREYALRGQWHRSHSRYVCPVFYKDGKTAFVRMVETNLSWRADKSLKRYSPQEINRMLHLRGIEKIVLGNLGQYSRPHLTYYQPPTERREESLREFELGAVELDYSHITMDHPSYGFVENRESIDYKLPREINVITGAAKVKTLPYLMGEIVKG